jgi:hypothetical protein
MAKSACSSFKVACMQVLDKIEGRNGKQLPWEGASLSVHSKTCLGLFRESLLMLLSRDPAMRPSMKQFYRSCDNVLAGTALQA